MNAPSNEPLTPIGERRRQAMLTELTGYMERVHHGRRLRRRGAALAVLLALSAVIAVAAMSGRNGPPPKTIAGDLPTGTHPAEITIPDEPASLINVAIVKSDPAIVDKYRATVTTYTNIRVERLDDETLLSELAAMGRPAGLISMEGKTYLTADVSDEALRDQQLNQAPGESTETTTSMG
jgi:hypothetical protein